MSNLDEMAVSSPDAYTLTDDYHIFLESMLGYLRENSTSNVVLVSPEQGWLYRFDLTSFLIDNNVPMEDHRLIMRVNGMTTPTDFNEQIRSLIIPDQGLIGRMKAVYRTKM